MDTMLNIQAHLPWPVTLGGLALFGVCIWKGRGFALKWLANGLKFDVHPPAATPKPSQKARNKGRKKGKRTRRKRK